MLELDYLKKYKKKITQNDLDLLSQNYPVQYLIGHVDFLGLKIMVNEDVLIPRFETEYFVERILHYLEKKPINNLLDIGTGSGCIAIAIGKRLNIKVVASDISSKALKVANENACFHNCDINFVLSNLFENINEKFDVIVSNPPYLNYKDDIMPRVRDYEPHEALFADNKGLFIIEKILKASINYLNEAGLIALEIGDKQAEIVKEKAQKCYPKARIIVESDLQGKKRYVFIIKNQKMLDFKPKK